MASIVGVFCRPWHRSRVAWLMAVLLTTTPGCDWWNADDQSDVDETLPALDFAFEDAPSAVEGATPLRTGFQPGQRFGFRKTVEQTLTQDLRTGPATSRSHLDLTFELAVAAVEAERTQFRVLFHRVRYVQELSGRRLEYDWQTTPGGDLPAEVQLYHGLANNGFAVLVPANGGAIELIGVDEFVERCIQHLPSEARERSRQYLTDTWTAGMASELVEETVRLIPPDVELAEGNTTTQIGREWTRQSVQPDPVPMALSTTATLRSFEEQMAEVGVTGRIEAFSSVVPAAAQTEVVRTTVLGGECSGSYSVDRRTRLPVRASLDQIFDMQVVAAGGESFDQQKRVVTTVQAVPVPASTALAPPTPVRARRVRPAVPIDASNHTPLSDFKVRRR